MQRNKIFLNIILLLSGLLFSVLCIEVLLRVVPLNNDLYYKKLEWNHWGESEMVQLYNRLYIYDDVLGYERKDVYESIKNVLKNNSSSYKILVLGDSITQWGRYVDYFNNLLVARYNNKIKVINAGVMGYDTELEYRYLKYRGFALSPNLVILQFCMNDFRGTPIIMKQKDGSWFALNGNKRLDQWIKPEFFTISKLYEFISLRLLYLSTLRKNNKDIVKVPLQKIKDLLEEKRIPFYVIVFPWLTESQCIETGQDDHKEIMNTLAELKLGSQVIDLLPYYSHASFDKIRTDLVHPNEEGDRIAAMVLMDKLKPLLDKQFE